MLLAVPGFGRLTATCTLKTGRLAVVRAGAKRSIKRQHRCDFSTRCGGTGHGHQKVIVSADGSLRRGGTDMADHTVQL